MLIFLSIPGKPAEDEVKLGSLKLKPNTKIMMMGSREESLVGSSSIHSGQTFTRSNVLYLACQRPRPHNTQSLCVFCFAKEDVLAPPPENDDVVNDFDIEEEVIEVENRYSRTLQRQLIYTVAPVIQVIDLARTLLDTMVSFSEMSHSRSNALF